MKKIISIALSFVLAFSVAVCGHAKKKDIITDYPIVLVHGMGGHGENTFGQDKSPYWGLTEENDIAQYLRGKGFKVCVPSVGPLSSAWDRACELYAQLTGTVVDYGEAHSKEHNHSRYGRDYSGEAMLSSDWLETTKINLIGHSFGGPTSMIFSSLLTYGDEAEIKASGENVSPLFEGGHDDAINAVLTLESPFNGALIDNVMYDSKIGLVALATMAHIEGMKENPSTDYIFDQFGITTKPIDGNKAKFNPTGLFNLIRSEDNCGYDMTLGGAKENCEKYKASNNIYYFTYAANMVTIKNGFRTVDAKTGSVLAPFGFITSMLAGGKYNGIKTDESWAYNDGLVSAPSAKYPYSQNHADYVDGMKLEKGVWYSMGVFFGNHGYGVGASTQEELFGIWDGIIETLEMTIADK